MTWSLHTLTDMAAESKVGGEVKGSGGTEGHLEVFDVATPLPRCKDVWSFQLCFDSVFVPPPNHEAKACVSSRWDMPHQLRMCFQHVAEVMVKFRL